MARGKGEGSPRKRKDGRWEWAITIGKTKSGNAKRISFYGETRTEVLQKAEDWKSKHRVGQTMLPNTVTVTELYTRWLEFRATNRKLKATTVRDYGYIFKQYIAPHVGAIRVAHLEPLHLEQMQTNLAKADIGPRTILHARGLLSSALKQAMRWGLVARNVAELVDAPRAAKVNRKTWTPEQARAFLDAARGERLYALFHLGLVTGMRRGELLGLRWQDLELSLEHQRTGTVGVNKRTVRGRGVQWNEVLVGSRIGFGSQQPERINTWFEILEVNKQTLTLDSSAGTHPTGTKYVIETHQGNLRVENTVAFIGATVVQQTPKTEASKRQINLDPFTVRALLERREASDFERRAAGAKWQEYDLVFGSSVGTPVWESSLRRVKTRIATLANVPDLSVHAVRYTYTSLAVLRGLDIKVVSERLGHSTTRMTQDVYQQVYNQQRRGAALSSDQLLGKSALNGDKLNDDQTPTKKASGQKTSGKKTADKKPVKRKKKPTRSDDETP
jgi:integrase